MYRERWGDKTNFSVTVVARLRRPHILQSPVGGKICGSFARIPWLEEVCHWGQDLRFWNLMPFPAEISLLSVWCLRYELSACCSRHCACLLPRHGSHDGDGLLSPWTCKPTETPLSKSCLGHGLLLQHWISSYLGKQQIRWISVGSLKGE